LTAAGGVNPVGQALSVDNVFGAWFGKGPERVGGWSLEVRRAILRGCARVTVLPSARQNAFDPNSIKLEFLLGDPEEWNIPMSWALAPESEYWAVKLGYAD
jgi:hypothetical protein